MISVYIYHKRSLTKVCTDRILVCLLHMVKSFRMRGAPAVHSDQKVPFKRIGPRIGY